MRNLDDLLLNDYEYKEDLIKVLEEDGFEFMRINQVDDYRAKLTFYKGNREVVISLERSTLKRKYEVKSYTITYREVKELKRFKNGYINQSKNDNFDWGMSRHHGGYIKTTYRKLKEQFGMGTSLDRLDKSSVNYVIELENGVIFSIYDWKEYGRTPRRNQDTVYNFHIGTWKKEETLLALEFLEGLGFNNG